MSDGQIVSFGPYRLDTQKEQFWCETKQMRLTPKAFQVLCYVVERPGQLVTKEELFRILWADTVVSDAALTTCIQEIRKALQDNSRSPQYLETVHRRGFRFIGEVNGQSSHELGGDLVIPAQAGIQASEAPVVDNSHQTGSTPPATSSLVLPSDSLVSSRFTRGFVLAAGLLLAVTVLTVQYLSRPTLSTQISVLATEEAKLLSLPLPNRPSIIVLPFVNLSEDAEQEYFSDGITDNLITDLSRVLSLFVIAYHSAFTYKGKTVKVQDVGREMGVHYVLEGSVQKADQRVRINVQLVDALSGDHVWVERFDRPLKDIFVVQDEIVQKIVTTLKLQLPLEEQGVLVRKTTENLEAYDYYLRGLAYFFRFTQEANMQARQMLAKAIALDPQYAVAYVDLSYTYYIDWVWAWSRTPQTLEQTLELAQKAASLDDSLPGAHSLLGKVYALKQQYDQAIAEGERAIALAPNYDNSYASQAEVLNIVGRPEEALRAVEQAMRLNPRYPAWYLIQLGWAYNMTGRYSEAIPTFKKLISRNPDLLSAYFQLATSYLAQWSFQLSQDPQTLEQARAAAQRAIALNDSSPEGHGTLGFVYLWQKQYDLAVAEMERVITLAPNAAGGYAGLAEILSRMGRSEEALQMVTQALRRNPSVNAYPSIGGVHYLAGQLEEAIAPLKQYLARYHNFLGAHVGLAAAYSELGREAEAQAEAAEVLRLNPHFSLEVARQRTPIKDPVVLERSIAALRKAGLR